MFPEITELKIRRKHVGLSVKKLSKITSISAWTIRKIENQTIKEPGYHKVKTLFEVIINEENKQKTSNLGTAENIHQTQIVKISEETTIKKTFQLMNEHDFSQLPIIDKKGAIIGSISFDFLKNEIIKGHHPQELFTKTIRTTNAIQPPFPQVPMETNNLLIALLLKENKAVLTMNKKGIIKGIITEADLSRII